MFLIWGVYVSDAMADIAVTNFEIRQAEKACRLESGYRHI